MHNRLSAILLLAWLGCAAFPVGADQAEQVRVLKLIFAEPEDRWEGLLVENRPILDPEFFERVEQRIRWSQEHCHAADAWRFAVVGDLALKVLGKKSRFVANLGPGFADAPVRDELVVRKPVSAIGSFPARPSQSRLAIRNARAAVRRGQEELAERLYRQALVDNPKTLTGWLELAQYHDAHGKSELALQEYRHATRLWPRAGITWRLRGRCAEAHFERGHGWDYLDESRFAYAKSLRLGEPSGVELERLNSKARALAKQTVNLEAPGAWELRAGDECYSVGEVFADHRYQRGDPGSGGSLLMETGEWRPLESRPGEDLKSYLERSYEDEDSSLMEAEYGVTGGLWRGHIVWLRTDAASTRLWHGEHLIGSPNSSRQRWPLGKPFARFLDRQSRKELQLFRSSMCEIGLEVLGDKVVALYLMEPGRLRVNLQRLPRYREVAESAGSQNGRSF